MDIICNTRARAEDFQSLKFSVLTWLHESLLYEFLKTIEEWNACWGIENVF